MITELRLGNMIHCDLDEATVTVTAILKDGISTNVIDKYFPGTGQLSQSIFGFSPIPLTKEILIKVGFKDCKKSPDWMRKGDFIISLEDWGIVCRPKGGVVLSEEIEITNKFFHQIQNLHYALTGEELTITETDTYGVNTPRGKQHLYPDKRFFDPK